MATGGRKSKLTPERQEKILGALLAGNLFSTACRYAGIAEQTGYEWLARGEGKDPRGRTKATVYAKFAEAVRGAEARAEVHAVAIVWQGFADNPRLALDFLGRRYPERWGPNQTLTVLRRLAREVQGMSDEELIAALEAHGDEDRSGQPRRLSHAASSD